MGVKVIYPGVYIDEVQSARVITGVGTSTAAFLGPNKHGIRNKAVRITSWDGFLKEFWTPLEKPNDTDYLWYAIKGFFENGGKTCFVINVSDATDESPQIHANAYVSSLKLLEQIDNVNLVVAPGRADDGVQHALIEHCERLQDRIALLETECGAPLFGAGGAEGRRLALDSEKGYAALYYPWVFVPSMSSGRNIPVPPTGHVAGIIARTDAQRGVHKAPAGLDATVNGVLGITQGMSDAEQGILNRLGVNIIRVFQIGGLPVVWGARTTASNGSNWQYISTRRLFLFLEESIQEGIRWAVFEPSNLSLWQRLKRGISAFLREQWRNGALFGSTEEEAFYVRIDEVINPPSERKLGRLNIEVGVKPSFQSEFISMRIGIWQGGSEVVEA